jgi:hypothetical protein
MPAEAFAVPARLSAGSAAALPIMARLKIAAAAKVDFRKEGFDNEGIERDIFVAPNFSLLSILLSNNRNTTTRRAIEFHART